MPERLFLKKFEFRKISAQAEKQRGQGLMNENVVDMMARKIADYITYLETNHELSISIKFSRK